MTKQIKISDKAHELLSEHKNGQTWSEYLVRIHRRANTDPVVALSGPEYRAIASAVADEIERRGKVKSPGTDRGK